MATKTLFQTAIALALTPAVLLMPAGTADAAMVFDFTSGDNSASDQTVTISSLQDGTPTDTSTVVGGMDDVITTTGSFTGVTDNTDSFTMNFKVWTTASVSGNDVTLTTANATIAANITTGIAPSNGEFKGDTSQGMSIVFNLSGLEPGTTLRLTDFVANLSSGTTSPNVLLVVDGKSSTDLGGLTGSSLSIDIADGDMLFIKNNSTTNDRFRVGSFTLEAVPEPGSLALLGLGGLCVLRRRRNA